MKALRYFGPRDVRYESMDDPVLHDDRDVLVKVTGCAICGSDLHIYHGEGFSEDLGFCVGHEAVGEVVEIGRGVRRLKSGDKVMISAAVGCGACPACLRGDVIRCETGSAGCYGLSSKLQGSQAEAVRVPAGDFNAALIPEGITEDQALLMTDGMATAWYGARNADISSGKTAAVVGLGPIGLMAVEQAFVLGAARVFAIDPVAERRAIAETLGATALHPDDAVETIRELTRGRMVDSTVEAVGHARTIDLALNLAARRGTVSVIGVNQDRRFDFPMARAFMMGLTFRIGTCSVQETWPELIPLVQAGRLKPERVISHRLPLSDGAEAYAMFDGRKDGALKMILTP
ncbi:alcohol dehydrogenase catalytic domain-containing protein [Caulobacter sp. SLTY]|uniref:alcohol dehydrogenase family protein n=1 Tax=Caulobacter sp. SLTY TaxID=2683262 RepID=UPI0014136E8A|nr:alcohol dehydrogenase family protein [Caulobacter sp. SLTY]NBB16470.1 alcohol dehydrogenase catalytic domain-containing protein [Caulobacter sp. SLTY]